MRQIFRDSFARTTTMRETVFTDHTCSWCGQGKRTKSGRGFLFVYITEHDGGRKSEHTGQFCSKECHNNYHNV